MSEYYEQRWPEAFVSKLSMNHPPTAVGGIPSKRRSFLVG